MPRYFFHLRDGADIQRDVSGFDCADLQTAKVVAGNCMREMVAEGDEEISSHSVEIADSGGNVLATVRIAPLN